MHLKSIKLDFADISGVSPYNARFASAPDAAIKTELAPQILRTGGPIDPLVVIQDPERGYEVLEGRRRWLAMQHLIDQGALHADLPLPVQVFEGDEAEAREVSLMGDSKAALSDPILAQRFAQLSTRLTPPDIAAHFGKSERAVRQLIALGKLAQPVWEAWRDGEIIRASAEAYTIGAPSEQTKIFANRTQRNSPATIRSVLHGDSLDAASSLARYVGVDAYLAAKGRISGDLFSETAVWLDPAIAKGIAGKQLGALAKTIAKREYWGWSRSEFDEGTAELLIAPDIETAGNPCSEPEAKRLDEIRAEMVKTRPVDGDEGKMFAHEIERREALRKEIAAIEAKAWTRGVAPERRKKLGVIVSLSYARDGSAAVGVGVDFMRGVETAAMTTRREAQEMAERAAAKAGKGDRAGGKIDSKAKAGKPDDSPAGDDGREVNPATEILLNAISANPRLMRLVVIEHNILFAEIDFDAAYAFDPALGKFLQDVEKISQPHRFNRYALLMPQAIDDLYGFFIREMVTNFDDGAGISVWRKLIEPAAAWDGEGPPPAAHETEQATEAVS